ncbi:Crp/Fnr family transcriptional regulator [Aquabacterium sp. OR-4]|uniref:Crp/Fnr family transcriptional regulator n=1 Tax=Aquabacterium sp. OR-4 TaxID=2978127 RepID=UPI0021B1E6D6|nr:Crp/Fnr family transcriptional regulator [Aquabacterium sp. OR-4]MDT7838038.1 Crp/Fnr family transcriptional regulator [Aquabacterium sp. OR-4]
MSEPCLIDFLEASPWRTCLGDAQMDRVHADSSLRGFAAGSTVCLRGSPAMHWLGVADGMLKVDTIAADGRSTTFAGVPAGAWFGEGAALKGEPRPYAVVALRHSQVAFIPRATFLWLIDDSQAFSRWVIDQLNARLGHYVALVESFRLRDLTTRVAYSLAELYNPQLYPGTRRELVISQEEIARLCGLSRPNLNRELHRLEEAGYLRIGYGAIEVLDLDGLQRFSRSG